MLGVEFCLKLFLKCERRLLMIKCSVFKPIASPLMAKGHNHQNKGRV